MKTSSFFLAIMLSTTGILTADSSEQINQQINQLQTEIDQFRVDQMNVNTESQRFMHGQPARYAEAMKQVEALDGEINTLEQRLAELKAQHDKLLKEINSPKQ